MRQLLAPEQADAFGSEPIVVADFKYGCVYIHMKHGDMRCRSNKVGFLSESCVSNEQFR